MNSETFHYKRGANQIFSQPTHFVDPSKFQEEDVGIMYFSKLLLIEISYGYKILEI